MLTVAGQRGTTEVLVPNYSATKARAGTRPGWTISFRHPLRTDTRGKRGLKVRRGLGTTDEGDADRLVAQMNELLSDETWWSAGKVQEAGRRFAKPVVDAFYDELQAIAVDSWAIRAQHIALPGPDSGYSWVSACWHDGCGQNITRPTDYRFRPGNRSLSFHVDRQNDNRGHRGDSRRRSLQSGGHFSVAHRDHGQCGRLHLERV